MNRLLKYSLFENIRQGKAILSKNDIPEEDPRWLALLDIFSKSPGYVGDFAYLVFEKGWTIPTVRSLKNDYIDSQSNKAIFNKIYPEIRKYKEEKFIDELMSLSKDRNITNVFNEFPSRQKELIDKSKSKKKYLYELSLRKDIKVFLKKIARYHTTKELTDAIKLFLSGEALTKHKDIFEKVERSGAQIVKNDPDNNLIIAKVNYSQLRQLGSHTSWCILSEGTFNSYTQNGAQYMVFLTDNIGNQSLIGTTIGLDVNTSHMVDDSYVSKDKLTKILKDRDFDISDLYQDRDKYIKNYLKTGSVFSLINKGFSKEEVFKHKNRFTYKDFRSIENNDPEDVDKYNLTFDNIIDYYDWEKVSEEDREKYDLKYKDSNRVGRADAISDFERGVLVDIDSHLYDLYRKFGEKIIPYISKSRDMSKVGAEILELVEKIDGKKFRTYEEARSRVAFINVDFLRFLLDRGIDFNDEKYAKDAKDASRFSCDCIGMLELRPSLLPYLKDRMISEGRTSEIDKIRALNIDEVEKEKIIVSIEKKVAAKYISTIMPSIMNQNWGQDRKEVKDALKKFNVEKLTPEVFMSDDVWGLIKKYRLWQGDWGSNSVYLVYAFMACAKLDRLNELNSIEGIKPMSYELMGRIIRSALQVIGGEYGYKSNGKSHTTPEFYLTEKERERLFTWLPANFDENELRINISNYIYDKSVGRHETFSLIYYIYGWGFDRYINIINNVKPLEKDIWTKDEDYKGNLPGGGSMVEKERHRPKYFRHVFAYLNSVGTIEEVVDLVDKILDMKNLRKYEVESLMNAMTTGVGYSASRTADDVQKACRPIFVKHGHRFTDRHYYYGYDD